MVASVVRASCLAGLVLLSTPSCSTPASVARATMDEAPARISSGIVGDLHVHVTMKRALPFFHGEPGTVVAAHPDESLVNQVDPEALLAHGVKVIVATLWAPPAIRPGRSAMDEALAQLEALRALPDSDGRFAVATSVEEARKIVASGRIALVPALEGAEAIERLEDVDALHAAGFRSLGLVHFVDNAIADAEDGQFGPLAAPLFDGGGRGLTALGRRAVERMIELGVVVDVAHSSPATVEDVLKIAEQRRVPIISSHVGSGMTAAHTLSDEHAKRIAALGGLIGIGLYRHDALVPLPAEDRFPGFKEGTCDEAIAHWLHFQRATSPSAVVLGSDLSSVIHRGRPGGSCPSGIRSSADLGGLFRALVGHGVPAEALSTSGERVLGVFQALADQASRAPVGKKSVPARSLDGVPL